MKRKEKKCEPEQMKRNETAIVITETATVVATVTVTIAYVPQQQLLR